MYPAREFVVRIVLVPILALLACTSGSTPAAFPSAFARASCAPTDGPAITIDLSPSRGADPLAPPLIQTSVYRPRADAVGRTWTFDGNWGSGYTSYCGTSTHCESATETTLTLGRLLQGDSIPGEIEARFPTAGLVRGTFRAAWVASREGRCG